MISIYGHIKDWIFINCGVSHTDDTDDTDGEDLEKLHHQCPVRYVGFCIKNKKIMKLKKTLHFLQVERSSFKNLKMK